MAQPEINGSLVGGASLKPEAFLPIIQQSQN
jgi:triosephosphate isomerase